MTQSLQFGDGSGRPELPYPFSAASGPAPRHRLCLPRAPLLPGTTRSAIIFSGATPGGYSHPGSPVRCSGDLGKRRLPALRLGFHSVPKERPTEKNPKPLSFSSVRAFCFRWTLL